MYDAPWYADWLVWWSAFWLVFSGCAVGFSSDNSDSLPRWLDGLLAAAFFGALLGVLPAWIRLAFRRHRARKKAAARPELPMTAHPTAPSAVSMPAHPTFQPDPDQASPTTHAAGVTPWPVVDRGPVPAPTPPSSPPRTVAPTPVDVLDTRGLARSAALTNGRNTLPYPAARAIRGVQLARDRSAQYEAVIDAGEALTLSLGITAVAWLRFVGASTAPMHQLQQAFQRQGVSQGQWLAILDQLGQELHRYGDPFPGLTESLRRGKGGTGLLADLRLLLEERNRWAHGARPRTAVEAGSRLLDVGPALERAVERSAALTDASWTLVESSSYRRDGSFGISGSLVMGDHPEYERIEFTSPRPMVDHDIYLRASAGYINLTPLVLMRFCETCRQPELCYADRIDERNGVALKSFANGHVIFDQDLAGEVSHLFADGSASTG